MPRIDDSELKRLKEEISVERLIEASGIELRKAGKDLSGKCPFHEDDTASLVVTPQKNLWHCFGCSIGGGPIDWVMKKNGVSFRHAVELLREGPSTHSGQGLTANSGTVKHSSVRVLPPPVVIDADDRALLQQVVSYYHERLKQSPEALGYLQARGLHHPELIETFKLGLADRTLGLRLPNKQRKDGAEIRTRLEKLGVYRESGHEHFNGSLVVPVFACNDGHPGQVCELYGRKIRDDLRPGTPKHLYLPQNESRGRGVFNEGALLASKEIILCEALIDALTFWCAGYRNVTSSYGIEGFTDEHVEAFKRHGTERVLIAYDRDEAGERGAQKVAERLLAEGIDCYRIEFPKGMDANEYALKVQPANKSLGLLIRKAAWLGKGTPPQRDAMRVAIEPARPVIELPPNHDDQNLPSLAAKTCPEPVEGNDDDAVTLPASVQPPAPAHEVASEITGEGEHCELKLVLGERHYRVRGLTKNTSYETMRVNVRVSAIDRFYLDTLDLYSAKQRQSYALQAAIELQCREEALKGDLGRVLLALEQWQSDYVQSLLAPKAPVAAAIDPEAEREAMALLRAPDLLDRIVADFDACGIVGEASNKLVGYLAAVSRKLERPLAVVIQSSSAAGKSSLMDAVLAFVPEEERLKYSAMTGQSLFYMGETNLKHKILAIAEEEGASRASYALKLLQSEGELTIASTGKDPASGNLITQQYRVEGPVMIFLTTTAIEVDEELMNRCLVLSVDEGRAQTEAIHRLQRARRTLGGLIAREEKARRLALHQNAQRLLKPLCVVNPFADQLTFLSDRTRTRRDHEKYLTLIDTIALLHQHQRPIKTTTHRGQTIEYIEVSRDDIAQANRLAHSVLGQSLDELPPQTRVLLGALQTLVRTRAQAQAVRANELRFTRKEVRAAIGWSDTQLRVHLDRLVALEYLIVHRGMRGVSFEYELLYDGVAEATPHLSGLIDVAAIDVTTTSTATTASSRGQVHEFAPPSRAQRAPNAGSSPLPESSATPHSTGAVRKRPATATQNALLPGIAAVPSLAAVHVA
jgi:DNA primase